MRTNLARVLLAALFLSWQAHAAQFVIVNADFPNEGFNDPTPAAPIGGNPGTTLGEQRLNVFLRAAEIWGKSLKSEQTIHVFAFFDNTMFCNITSATLGGAASAFSYANVPAAPRGNPLPPDTWYPAALTEKITNQDIVDPAFPFEIFAIFNPDLGTMGCLPASPWYHGLDNAEPPNQIDFLAVVLHELAHGLGFSVQPTIADSGERALGLPSVWEQFMLDTSTGKRWIEMTDAERAASARNTLNLVWVGHHGSNVVPSVLDFRTGIDVLSPAALGAQDAQPASFGPTLRNGHDVVGTVVTPNDGGGASLLDGCEAFPAGSGVAGNIALVDRGNCTFAQKVKNAQNAGAVAAIVANNAPGLPGMGGADPTIVIPSFGITQALGTALRAAPQPVIVSLGLDPTVRAGTVANFPRLYTPVPFAQGSSVSHWDVSATPNLLMEPNINSDLVSRVRNPDDLTRNLFTDIGW